MNLTQPFPAAKKVFRVVSQIKIIISSTVKLNKGFAKTIHNEMAMFCFEGELRRENFIYFHENCKKVNFVCSFSILIVGIANSGGGYGTKPTGILLLEFMKKCFSRNSRWKMKRFMSAGELMCFLCPCVLSHPRDSRFLIVFWVPLKSQRQVKV